MDNKNGVELHANKTKFDKIMAKAEREMIDLLKEEQGKEFVKLKDVYSDKRFPEITKKIALEMG